MTEMSGKQGNNPLWSLLKSWVVIIAALLSAASVLITYLFLPAQYRWSLPLFAVVVIVVGVIAAARKEIKGRDNQIAKLQQEIEKLKIKPYDVALRDEAELKLKKFTDQGREVLRYILLHGPVYDPKLNVSGVDSESRNAALKTGVSNSLIRRTDKRPYGTPRTEAYWDITEQFKPVLKDLLFPK